MTARSTLCAWLFARGSPVGGVIHDGGAEAAGDDSVWCGGDKAGGSACSLGGGSTWATSSAAPQVAQAAVPGSL